MSTQPKRKPAVALMGCPRCAGDVIRKEDEYGPFLDCLQCGWHGVTE